MSDPSSNESTALERALEQEARRLVQARMLPNEGPLSVQQRQLVRDDLLAYMQSHGVTQREVARQTGVGASVINQVVNNTYIADPDDHLRAINDWMEVDARRRRSRPQRKFVETRVAKKLLFCANKASEGGLIVVATGPSGIGKSMVAHVIAERFPGAIYIRISAGQTSYLAVRRMIGVQLRLFARKRKKGEASTLTFDERIFEKLRNSHRLLIVDEAHRISDCALDFVRDLYDECGIPVLLLATKDLVDRLRQDSDADHGQLYSRLGWTCDLTRGFDKTPGGKHPLFSVLEIRQLYEGEKIKLHPDAAGYLQDVANMLGHGSLRSCDRLMLWAVAIERAVKHLPPEAALTLSADLLRKAETESKDDSAMFDDAQTRWRAAAAG